MNVVLDKIQWLIMKMQCFLILPLNWSYKYTAKFTKRQREIFTFILASLFSVFLIWTISRFNLIDMPKKSIVFMFGMILVAVVNVDRKLKPKEWNMVVMVPYYIVAALMLITSFTHNTGRGELHLISIIMFFFMPLLYIVLGNKNDREVERFYVLLTKAFCYTGCVYIFITILFFPKTTQYIPESGVAFNEYLGINLNPNAFGFVLCSIVACSIYLYVLNNKKIVPLIVIALSIQLMNLAVARTSMITYAAMIFAMLVAMILMFAWYKKYHIGKENILSFHSPNKRWKWIAYILCAIIFVIVSQPLWVMLYDFVQTAYANSETTMSTYDKLNSLLSGRLEIYKHYIEHITWFGTDSSQIYYNWSGVGMYAHNTFLDVAFKSGIFAGIAYLIMIISVFIYSIKYFISSKGEYGLFGIIVTIGFTIYSMFETAIMPFHDGLTALLYISIGVVVVKRNKIPSLLDKSETSGI